MEDKNGLSQIQTQCQHQVSPDAGRTHISTSSPGHFLSPWHAQGRCTIALTHCGCFRAALLHIGVKFTGFCINNAQPFNKSCQISYYSNITHVKINRKLNHKLLHQHLLT